MSTNRGVSIGGAESAVASVHASSTLPTVWPTASARLATESVAIAHKARGAAPETAARASITNVRGAQSLGTGSSVGQDPPGPNGTEIPVVSQGALDVR